MAKTWCYFVDHHNNNCQVRLGDLAFSKLSSVTFLNLSSCSLTRYSICCLHPHQVERGQVPQPNIAMHCRSVGEPGEHHQPQNHHHALSWWSPTAITIHQCQNHLAKMGECIWLKKPHLLSKEKYKDMKIFIYQYQYQPGPLLLWQPHLPLLPGPLLEQVCSRSNICVFWSILRFWKTFALTSNLVFNPRYSISSLDLSWNRFALINNGSLREHLPDCLSYLCLLTLHCPQACLIALQPALPIDTSEPSQPRRQLIPGALHLPQNICHKNIRHKNICHKISATKISAKKIATKISATKISATKYRPQKYMTQILPKKISATKIYDTNTAKKISATKISATKISATRISATKISATKICHMQFLGRSVTLAF